MTVPAEDAAERGRLPGIEALRGIAALCVLMLHARAVFGGGHYFGRGYLGVDFFLMLSGFWMARTAEPRLAAGLPPWRLVVRRYRRLWPVMAIAGLIGLPRLALRTAGWVQFALFAAANLALLPVPQRNYLFPLNIPAWTIFAEMAANALHAVWLHRLRARGLAALIVLAGGGAMAAGAWRGSFDMGARPDQALAALPRVGFAYLIGVALARHWRGRIPPAVPPALALVAMPGLIVAAHFLHFKGWWCDFLFVALVCPAMIAGGLRLRRFGVAAGLAGRLSFPLFAVQVPVMEAVHRLHGPKWAGIGAALAAAAVVAGITGRRRLSLNVIPQSLRAHSGVI